MANDPEYVDAALASLTDADIQSAPKTPPMSTWTPEVAKLNEVVNEIKALKAVLMAVNAKKGSAAPEIKPSLGPETLFDKRLRQFKFGRRLARHQELTRKLLGNRAGTKPPLI